MVELWLLITPPDLLPLRLYAVWKQITMEVSENGLHGEQRPTQLQTRSRRM